MDRLRMGRDMEEMALVDAESSLDVRWERYADGGRLGAMPTTDRRLRGE